MDGIFLAEHLIKTIEERRKRIVQMLAGGAINDMEEYRQLVGSLESLEYIGQELKDILEKAD